MKNIHVLPTNKRSKLATKDSNNKLEVSEKNTFFVNGFGFTTHNIYITNSEEIKEGDWFLNDMNILFKADKNYIENPAKEVYIGHKKIILTTDQDLIDDGVQDIDDEFLEWFVKNPSCDEIYVNKIESFDFGIDKYVYNYKIIIPKEEPKQETLEEAAEKYATNHGMMAYVFPEKKESFIQGAKWQKEQDKNKYSEEEVVKLLIKFNQEIQEVENVREWFEEFKKK